MSKLEADVGDSIWMGLFVVASAAQLRVTDVTPFGFDPATELWAFTADGWTTSITVAAVVALASLGAIMWTNDVGLDALSGLQGWMVLVVIWLVLAPPFMPIMTELTMGSDAGKFLAMMIQFVGVGVVSYLG
ncbi:hypothetical protein [Halostella sp. PRR32]|uniref:hypothetical protein n=1 Tax=Halostella sp. PRR32 TaxID=3098147 RepID=UPI002B1D86CA|nr:hypothetical protein [Halostella sp. PRR32]